MRSDQEIEAILRSELRNSGLLMSSIPSIPSKKQTLLQCLGITLRLDPQRLHQMICQHLVVALEQNTLPRRLGFIKKDKTYIEDYKKYPYLVNFINITLQMVSQIQQTKITCYSLCKNGFALGQIVNQKNYQKQIKIGRVNNNFYEVKDSQESTYSFSHGQSNNSAKLFQAFQPQKNIKNTLPSPILTRSVSAYEDTKKIPVNPIQQQVPVPQKSFDQVSLQNKQNIGEENAYISQCSQSIQEDTYPPNLNHQYSQMYPYNQYQPQMYYQPYLYRQSSNKSEGYINSYSNLPPPPQMPNNNMSPSKLSSSRRQNSTMEINQNERYTGRLKFFDEAKNYGFIIMDGDQSDIFVHCDDLQKAGINKERVKCYKQSEGLIRFSFKVMSYFGKYKDSRKAVDLNILDDGLSYQ